MGKHAIVVIKNEKNEYLQYFDDKWSSYLFLNCKMDNRDDTDSIIELLDKTLNLSKNNINCLFKGEKRIENFRKVLK